MSLNIWLIEVPGQQTHCILLKTDAHTTMVTTPEMHTKSDTKSHSSAANATNALPCCDDHTKSNPSGRIMLHSITMDGGPQRLRWKTARAQGTASTITRDSSYPVARVCASVFPRKALGSTASVLSVGSCIMMGL